MELRFAAFFLCKLLRSRNADVDINHLQSLDPDFYKSVAVNLVSVSFQNIVLISTAFFSWGEQLIDRD